jgi:hypothetical protein
VFYVTAFGFVGCILFSRLGIYPKVDYWTGPPHDSFLLGHAGVALSTTRISLKQPRWRICQRKKVWNSRIFRLLPVYQEKTESNQSKYSTWNENTCRSHLNQKKNMFPMVRGWLASKWWFVPCHLRFSEVIWLYVRPRSLGFSFTSYLKS